MNDREPIIIVVINLGIMLIGMVSMVVDVLLCLFYLMLIIFINIDEKNYVVEVVLDLNHLKQNFIHCFYFILIVLVLLYKDIDKDNRNSINRRSDF